MKKKLTTGFSGDQVYENRYNITIRHIVIIFFVIIVFPLTLAMFMLLVHYSDDDDNFVKGIPDSFTYQIALQKLMLGNGCEIDTEDPSEILQYKHFIHSCLAVGGLLGIFVGQFGEWIIFSNRGKINQSIWNWYWTSFIIVFFRLLITALVASALLFYESVITPKIYSMTSGTSKFMTGTLICFMLPYFLLSCGIFGLLRQLFFKLSLDNPKSIGKEFMPKEMIIGNTADDELEQENELSRLSI